MRTAGSFNEPPPAPPRPRQLSRHGNASIITRENGAMIHRSNPTRNTISLTLLLLLVSLAPLLAQGPTISGVINTYTAVNGFPGDRQVSVASTAGLKRG